MQKEARILLVGLDAAGKTTLLYQLKLQEQVHTIPTFGFNVEEVRHNNCNLTLWDLGGQDKIRPLWHHYFQAIQAVVFVVDSADRERLPEAKEELHKLLQTEQLSNAVFLVLANKQDLPTAVKVHGDVLEEEEVLLGGEDWTLAEDAEFEDVAVVWLDHGEDPPTPLDIPLPSLTDALDLFTLPPERKWSIQPTNAVSGEGLREALDWLVKNVP